MSVQQNDGTLTSFPRLDQPQGCVGAGVSLLLPELTRVERTSVADLFFQNRREWQQELHNLPQDQRAPVNVLLQSLNIQVQD